MSSREWRPEDGKTRIDGLKFGDALAELSVTDAADVDLVAVVRASREDA
ncbi:MAG: hypothetical protein RI560_07555 [Natronomonas sp.]|nr:hypothetical protein [Natronomonas sp.]MDR9381512.1 hypothetical protein [Natronomonas sp.]MDR9431895.1 hypothetical protein [Natronomonas sp.]